MQSFLQVNFEFEVKLRGILLSDLLNYFNFFNQTILRCTLNIKISFDFTLQISVKNFKIQLLIKKYVCRLKKKHFQDSA